MDIQRPSAVDEFVSIRETVELIADEKEIDIDTVAGYIHRKLVDNCSSRERPRFFASDRIGSRLIERSDDFVIDRLREIERTGLFFEAKTGDGFRYCSDFGFVRKEIALLLDFPKLLESATGGGYLAVSNVVEGNFGELAEVRRARLVKKIKLLCPNGKGVTKALHSVAGGEWGEFENVKRIYYGK